MLLKDITERERQSLDPTQLASDGATVVGGIDAPSEDELLAFLHARGWDENGPPA